MKTPPRILLLILTVAGLIVLPSAATAALRSSADYAIPLDGLDSGGRAVASTTYTSIGSLGGIVGTAFVASTQAVFGIIGQIETQGPVITLPSPIVTAARNLGGVSVSFTLTATDDTDPTPAILASPSSGSLFPPGDTTVQVSATDYQGNRITGDFPVKVLSPVSDRDADGLNDSAEFLLAALGYDWQVRQTALVDTLRDNAIVAGLYNQQLYDANRVIGQTDVTGNPAPFGLYTLPQLQALKPSTQLIGRDPVTSEFTLTLGIAKSADLTAFAPFPVSSPQVQVNPEGKIELRFTSTENAAFFRVESD